MNKGFEIKKPTRKENDTIIMISIFFILLSITPKVEAEKDISEINLPTRILEIEDSMNIEIDAPLPKQKSLFRQFFLDDRLPDFGDFDVKIPVPEIFTPSNITENNRKEQGNIISANTYALIGTLSRIESGLSFASYFSNIKFSFGFNH